MSLLVKKLSERATTPARATSGSAGFDLSSIENVTIPSHSRAAVSTGIAIQIPPGTYGRIAPRSGLAFKHGIDVFAGVIDSDYINLELKVILYNSGDRDFVIHTGDRIAQLILEKIETPDVALVLEMHNETDRTGGFGSTGLGAV